MSDKKKNQKIIDTPISKELILSIILIALVRPIFAFAGLGRSWGIDYLKYFSLPETIIYTLAILIICIPSIYDSIFEVLKKINPKRFFFILSIIVLIIAFFFPMQTFFYGDGGLLPPQIYLTGNDSSHNLDILLNLKSSPLAGLLLVGLVFVIPYVYHLLHFTFVASSIYPFIWISIISFFCIILSLRLVRNDWSRCMILLGVLGAGGTLFLFGYVEFYTLVYAALFVYFISAQKFLSDNGSVSPVIIFYLIALAAHVYTIALLPSLIYVIIKKYGIKIKIVGSTNRIIASSMIILSAGIVFYFISGLYHSDNRIVMPLIPIQTAAGKQSYTLLSLYHLIDFVNIFFLLAPVATVFLLMTFLRKGSKSFYETDTFRFYFLSVFFFCGFLFFANTSLGLARDWDITAPLGIILSLTALFIIAHRHNEKNGIQFGLASIIAVIPWLVLNINPVSSAKRFGDVMELDAQHMYGDYALSGYEALRKFYEHEGNAERNIEFTQKMISILDYPSHYGLLINSSAGLSVSQPAKYLELKRWMLTRLLSKAKSLLSKGIRKDYSISFTQIDSLVEAIAYQSYVNQKYDQLKNDLDRVPASDGSNRVFHSINGIEAYFKKDYRTAAEELQKCVENHNEIPKIYGLLGSALYELSDSTRAEQIYTTALSKFPDDPELRFIIAFSYYQKRINPKEAKGHLEHALQNNPSDELKAQIQVLLRAISTSQNN